MAHKKEPRSKVDWALGGAVAAAFLVFVYVFCIYSLQDHAYSVEASTERFTLNTNDPTLNTWDVSGMALYGEEILDRAPDGQDENCSPLAQRTKLELSDGVKAEVDRQGDNGTLKIDLKRGDTTKDSTASPSPRGNGQSSIGELTFTNDQGETSVRSLNGFGAVLVMCPGQTPAQLVLPFGGAVTLGDDVAPGVQAIALAGKVAVISKTVVGDAGYINTSESLGLGDRLNLFKGPNGKLAEVAGFVRVETGKPMTLVYHGIADRAEVVRLGRATYEISPSLLAILKNDPLFLIAAAVFGIFWGIAEAVKIARGLLQGSE